MAYRSKLMARALEEYGAGAYTYAKVEAINGKSIIAVTCPEHGDFSTTADAFLYTAGCPQCRGKHKRGYPRRKNKVTKMRAGRSPERRYLYLCMSTGDRVSLTSAPCDTVLNSWGFRSAYICNSVHSYIRGVYFNGESLSQLAIKKAISELDYAKAETDKNYKTYRDAKKIKPAAGDVEWIAFQMVEAESRGDIDAARLLLYDTRAMGVSDTVVEAIFNAIKNK